MARRYLEDLERVRAGRLLTVTRTNKNQLKIENAPPTNCDGFYWIYTNYSVDELKSSIQSQQPGSANIAGLAALHDGLKNVCVIEREGYRLVYCGAAGASCGLRGRIHQHFNGGNGTGAIAICKSSLNDLTRWRVSYATFGYIEGKSDLSCDSHHRDELERIWKLQHGWPLLCMR